MESCDRLNEKQQVDKMARATSSVVPLRMLGPIKMFLTTESRYPSGASQVASSGTGLKRQTEREIVDLLTSVSNTEANE